MRKDRTKSVTMPGDIPTRRVQDGNDSRALLKEGYAVLDRDESLDGGWGPRGRPGIRARQEMDRDDLYLGPAYPRPYYD